MLYAFLNPLFWPLFESCFNKRRFKAISATYPNYIFSAFLRHTVVMYFVFAYLRHSTSVSIKVIVNRQHENIFFSNNLFLEGTQVPAWPNGPALMLREKVGIIFVRLNNQSSFMCFTMFQFHRIGFQTDVAVESKCLVIK